MTIKALETSILPKPFLLASPTPVNIIQPEKISKRAIFFAAFFCLESLFPRAKPRLPLIAAIGLLVLQSPLTYLAEIRQLPSVAGLSELLLPYLRFAIPQVIVPAVLAYLGLQTRVLKCGS